MSVLDELFTKPLDNMGYDEIGYFFMQRRQRAAMELDGLRHGIEMLKHGYKMMKQEAHSPAAAASILRAIPSEARAQASRENGKKGGRPKNRFCPICGKSVSIYRFADEWRFNQHYTDKKRENSIYPYYECVNSYAVAE